MIVMISGLISGFVTQASCQNIFDGVMAIFAQTLIIWTAMTRFRISVGGFHTCDSAEDAYTTRLPQVLDETRWIYRELLPLAIAVSSRGSKKPQPQDNNRVCYLI